MLCKHGTHQEMPAPLLFCTAGMIIFSAYHSYGEYIKYILLIFNSPRLTDRAYHECRCQLFFPAS